MCIVLYFIELLGGVVCEKDQRRLRITLNCIEASKTVRIDGTVKRDERAVGAMARECICPLEARVVSMPISTDFMISWRSTTFLGIFEGKKDSLI